MDSQRVPAGGWTGHAAETPGQLVQPGTLLNDRYEVGDWLAERSFGEIRRGRDVADGRLVMLTVFRPSLMSQPQTRTALEGFVQLASQLDHKNIAATYGLYGGMADNQPVSYLVSEHIDGSTLADMIAKKRSTQKMFSLKSTY